MREQTEEELEREYKRRAHECLMNGGGWLGVVYREQVKRVRELKRKLAK